MSKLHLCIYPRRRVGRFFSSFLCRVLKGLRRNQDIRDKGRHEIAADEATEGRLSMSNAERASYQTLSLIPFRLSLSLSLALALFLSLSVPRSLSLSLCLSLPLPLCTTAFGLLVRSLSDFSEQPCAFLVPRPLRLRYIRFTRSLSSPIDARVHCFAPTRARAHTRSRTMGSCIRCWYVCRVCVCVFARTSRV